MLKRHIISRLAWAALALSLVGALVVATSGVGYRLTWWGLRDAFTALMSAAGVAALGAVLAFVSFLFAWRRERRLAGVAAAALLCGGVAAAIPLWYLWTARHVPPIHDISTDTANPPEFVVLLPERKGAPNPASYGGPEVAALQHSAYPDIQPLEVAMPRAAAFEAALQAAQAQGWRIAASDAATGRIEAVDQTFWFGFIDDVVVRVTTRPDGKARIDARSVSRVGRGDAGTNARRLRDYLQDVDSRLAPAPQQSGY